MIITPTTPPLSELPQPPNSATQLSGLSQALSPPPRLSQPFSMNSAVIRPHAMNAAMLGRTMLERNVPNFCTRTRAPEPAAGVEVVVAMLDVLQVARGVG